MAVEQTGAPSAPPENETRIFEHPLNERMRTFLRLDFLYNQALYHNEMASQWGSRAAMDCLLDVLAIATRGDIRSEVLKELERTMKLADEILRFVSVRLPKPHKGAPAPAHAPAVAPTPAAEAAPAE